MTNETVCLVETEVPQNFTCADGTGIAKGAILKLADPATVSLAVAKEDVCGGIASEEKIASDGHVEISVWRRGRFKGTASGSITAGDALITAISATGNKLETAGVNAEDIVGISFESCTDGQTFEFELGPRTNNLA